MKHVFFADLIDQTRLMRYLTTIAESDRNTAIELLNHSLYFSVLQMCLPLFPLEKYQTVAEQLATQNGSSKSWLQSQRPEIQAIVPEIIDRFMLSLETQL